MVLRDDRDPERGILAWGIALLVAGALTIAALVGVIIMPLRTARPRRMTGNRTGRAGVFATDNYE